MISKERHFYFLLAGLLIALLVTPTASQHFPGAAGLMLTVTLLVSVVSLSASKYIYRAAWLLVGSKVLLSVYVYFHPTFWIYIAEAIIMVTFFVLATVFAFRLVLEDRKVDFNRIAGAISIYLLIGLIWASFYFFLYLMDPQSIHGLPETSASGADLFNTVYIELLYFSYVTLTTLGYGDITPVSRAAQSLAYVEAIAGVMYVAVLVASLISSFGEKRVTRS